MQDVIKLLLDKKATSTADCEAEKAAAIAEIESRYSERLEKIENLLIMAGYEEPEETEQEAEEITEETDEQPDGETVEQIVY